jgi:hypothetical protein
MAVESYEEALRGGVIDPKLSCKLARVLVKCHQYAKAIKCYRDSGKSNLKSCCLIAYMNV